MPLARSAFIRIPEGAKRGFDHADFYLDNSGGTRMYVANTGADRVDVLDCVANTWLRSLPGHPGVAGLLISRDDDLLFTSDRAGARVSIYRCSNEELLARIPVSARPSGLAFDPVRSHLFTFHLGEPEGENCTCSVIDVGSHQVIATVRLPGRPRWPVYDSATDQVFVPILDPAQILVISSASLAATKAFDVPASGPHGLWIDGDQLLCAADGMALVVLNRDTGVVAASLDLPGIPDVVVHDPELHHVYTAIREPAVISVADTRTLELIETARTEPGAHTLGIDPRRHAVYAFLPASSGALVYLDQQ
jgi:DNA-binding beta-propeller fold protein YncE